MNAHPVPFEEETLKPPNIDLIQPEHLANLISYLVKDEAKHITGIFQRSIGSLCIKLN